MQRHILYLFALTATALAAAGMAGCSTEEASTSECSPVDPAAVREALPDSLGEAKLDPQSAESDDHSFSALYRAEDKEQVSLLGTKYKAEGTPVCPDDPNEAAQRYLELLNHYLHRDGRDSAAEQQRMEGIGAKLAPALQKAD